MIAPFDNYVERLTALGVKHYDFNLSRRGKNPFAEIRSCLSLLRILRGIKPDIVLTFTVKCNLYTGLCRRLLKFEQIANVSGLGESFNRKGVLNKIVGCLYRFTLAKSKRVFFQNDEDRQAFIRRGLLPAHLCMRIAGSGVDLDSYRLAISPSVVRRRFLMFGRLVPEKGFDDFITVAESLYQQPNRNAELWIMGIEDQSRKESHILLERILYLHRKGILTYIPARDEVASVLHAIDVVVLPSQYNEGVPRSLLEAMACGKPIVTTNWKGCRDTVEHGVNGYLIAPGNTEELAYYIRRLASMSEKELQKMGEASRLKAEAEFSEKDILCHYLYEINHRGRLKKHSKAESFSSPRMETDTL